MSGDFSNHLCTASRVSHCHHQTQWMAHWMQGNNNVFPQYHASNKDNYLKGGHFQVNTKKRKGKMLSIDSTNGSNLGERNIFRSGTEFSLALCPDQSAESLGSFKEGSLELQKNLKMEDAGVGLSDTLSLNKLADASPNIIRNKACCCLNPEDIISQDDHFPMYGINRKIGSILNRNKGSICGQMARRLSETPMQHDQTACVSNVMKFASEEHHQLEAQKLTVKAPKMEFSKFVKALPICKDELTSSPSQPAGRSFRELRIGSWGVDHGISKHSINKFKHESCDLSGSSRFYDSEMKHNNRMISTCVRSSTLPKHIRSMNFRRDLYSDNLHFSPLDNQHGKYQINTAGNTAQASCSGFAHLQSSNDLGLSRPKSVKVPSCTTNDVETLRIHTTSDSTDNVNGGSQNISNSLRYWLIAKNMDADLSHREQLNVNPTQSAQDKSTALYEMLALPSVLNKQLEDTQNIVSSSRSIHCDDDSWSDAHIMMASKASATNTTETSIDTFQKEVCLEPVVSAKPPKDPERPWLTPLLVKQEICRDTQTEIVDSHLLFPISENAGSSNHRELSVPRTESMNADLVLSHVQNSHGPSSSSVLESSLHNEPCSRWLKRLRHGSSDIHSKRSKIGDGPTHGEACDVINYNTSNSDQQLNDVSKSSPSNAKCLPGASTKEVQCWVKRWCHKSPQVPQSSSAIYEQENSKLTRSSDGKQFPSIAAMALMGKVMKRLRTCEFRKKGFSVIWNAESL